MFLIYLQGLKTPRLYRSIPFLVFLLAGCSAGGISDTIVINEVNNNGKQIGEKMIFPTVHGSNLLRQKRTLPRDFQGEVNIVFVPFQQWQQSEVNSWVPWIMEMEAKHPGVVYYELPTIENRNIVFQTFINEGMRAGIPNPLTRERTITLYLNKADFQKSLDMPDEEHIYVLLIDNEGNVINRLRGGFTEESGKTLSEIISSLLPTGSE